MGLFQILRSIEELLYEVMTWLIFYPRTLWRTLRHPVAIMDYSDQEQGDSEEDQYTDLLSPPIFLLLSIILAHAIELALHARLEQPAGGIGKILGSSEEGLLMVRAILFSIYPLMFSVAVLKRSGIPIDRDTLRAPFFSQCYLGALFALLVSGATIMLQGTSQELRYAGLLLSVASAIWFVWVQAFWFAEHLGVSKGRGGAIALRTFIKGTLVNSGVAAVLLI